MLNPKISNHSVGRCTVSTAIDCQKLMSSPPTPRLSLVSLPGVQTNFPVRVRGPTDTAPLASSTNVLMSISPPVEKSRAPPP